MKLRELFDIIADAYELGDRFEELLELAGDASPWFWVLSRRQRPLLLQAGWIERRANAKMLNFGRLYGSGYVYAPYVPLVIADAWFRSDASALHAPLNTRSPNVQQIPRPRSSELD